jgi:hypothetical protein
MKALGTDNIHDHIIEIINWLSVNPVNPERRGIAKRALEVTAGGMSVPNRLSPLQYAILEQSDLLSLLEHMEKT